MNWRRKSVAIALIAAATVVLLGFAYWRSIPWWHFPPQDVQAHIRHEFENADSVRLTVQTVDVPDSTNAVVIHDVAEIRRLSKSFRVTSAAMRAGVDTPIWVDIEIIGRRPTKFWITGNVLGARKVGPFFFDDGYVFEMSPDFMAEIEKHVGVELD